MRTAQDIITEAMTLLHKDCLKPAGFSKSANTWICRVEWPQVINLQSSSSNTRIAAKVTFNLGVSIPALRNAFGRAPVAHPLKEVDCDLRTRIGELLPDGNDHWWEVVPETSSGALAEEFAKAVELYALPWLRRMIDLSNIAEEFTRQRSHSSASVAYALMSRREMAEASMRLALASAHPAALRSLRGLAKRLSLEIEEP